MAVFVVAYDLNKPRQNYEALLAELRRIDSFHAQKSLWFVDVPQTRFQLRNALATYLDSNDTLWVHRIFAGQWASWEMPGAAAWLAAHGVP